MEVKIHSNPSQRIMKKYILELRDLNLLIHQQIHKDT